MSIASPWKITWDPDGAAVVLVDFDDLVEEEIAFPARQKLEERQTIEGTDTDFLTRDLWSTRVRFARIAEHASLTAARAYLATHLAACQAVGRKPLRFEYDDGASGTDSVEIPNAALELIDGRNVARDGKKQTRWAYEFRGGALNTGS